MSEIKTLIISIMLFLPLLAAAQGTLIVLAEDVESSSGYIGVGLYNDSDGFLIKGKEFKGVFVKAQKGITKIEFSDLPEGTYAISIFHDENGNKEMDTNFIGIPKEPLGFSIGSLKTFGPPSFEECAFELKSDFEIKIPLE